jgi:hypothetical protein
MLWFLDWNSNRHGRSRPSTHPQWQQKILWSMSSLITRTFLLKVVDFPRIGSSTVIGTRHRYDLSLTLNPARALRGPGMRQWRRRHAAGAVTKEANMPATSTKSATIQKLITRKSGASISQLQAATEWQPHSVRAALSSLRKNGATITRSANTKGITVYRFSVGAS